MRAILLLLVLSACVANGPIYSEPKKPSIIVYRPETTIPKAGVFYIEANGVPVCNLLPLSYFVLNVPPIFSALIFILLNPRLFLFVILLHSSEYFLFFSCRQST